MALPLSSGLADYIMQKLENKIIPYLEIKLNTYIRYTDDILIKQTHGKEELTKLKDKLEEPLPTMKFTIEKGTENQIIAFVEINIMKTIETTATSWYCKYGIQPVWKKTRFKSMHSNEQHICALKQ